ncbi:MAG: hypothetical protein VXW97_04300 [Pseudomonadota bacterium]|nr:hypothetical protein [Pseudomonadota bacterium]
MFKYLLLLTFLISASCFACEDKISKDNNNVNNKFSIWLGNSSEFSKTFFKSKCILDQYLVDLSPKKKKVNSKTSTKII